MKRFLVFAWDMTYEEGGGWHDFRSCHDTLQQAEDARVEAHSEHGGSHVVDLELGVIVISQYERYKPVNGPQCLT